MRKCKYTKPLNNVARESGKFILSLSIGLLALLTDGAQLNAHESVQLNLSATIEKSCSVDRTGGTPDAGSNPASPEGVSLGADGTLTIGLTIDCNTPFTYSIESANGALVHTGGQSVGANSDSILTQVPFITTFAVNNLEDGDTANLSQSCDSGNLDDAPAATCNGGGFATSGTSVAIGESASLSIALDGTYSDDLLDGVPLLSGTFQDTLTFTVSVYP